MNTSFNTNNTEYHNTVVLGISLNEIAKIGPFMPSPGDHDTH